MEKLEQEIIRLRNKHQRAADTLEKDNQYIDAISSDAQLRRIYATETNNPVLHQQADIAVKGLQSRYKHRDTAQKKYDESLAASSAHKDKHFDKYVAIANTDLAAHETAAAAVLSSAEAIVGGEYDRLHADPTQPPAPSAETHEA